MDVLENQDDPFFGDLLKHFRRRKKLTQQQLATQIAASREAISLWERGQYKPETTTMVHELIRVLELDDEEKRLLFEAHLGTASLIPMHNLPDHNLYFTGREDILTHLHAHLVNGKPMALTQVQAITGLGGIGKTQVAIEYAYRFREHYHDILWVLADSREALVLSYVTVARQLRLREREEREQQKVVEAVKRWLHEHKGWLLILDNIENLALVQEFVPTPRQGSLLLTTQREETRPVARAIPLDSMTEGEGSLFLLKRAGYLDRTMSPALIPAQQWETAKVIVQTLGGLPLALDQAGAYIAETKCSHSDYLALYQEHRSTLLARRGMQNTRYLDSVATTWSLSFQKIQQSNPAAAELLRLCAFLAPDHIPEELLKEGAPYWTPLLQAAVTDLLTFNHMLEDLLALSFVKRLPEDRLLSIHRLVQTVQMDRIDAEEQCQWAERIVRAVNTVFPRDPDEVTSWSHCLRYLEQVQVCDALIQKNRLMLPEAADLLHRSGIYLSVNGSYTLAEPLYLQALRIREQQLGAQHPDTASTLYHLGGLYLRQGKYEQAELCYQQALAIREQQLGPHHPGTINTLNNLGVLYWYQGKYEQAEPFYQQVLAIRSQHLGLHHPDTSGILDNLGLLYWQQGKYEQAEPLYIQALSIRSQHLGLHHPDTANTLNNLGALYWQQGKYEQAEPLYEQALTTRKHILGSKHPDTARSLNNLAELYLRQGKREQAEPLFAQALNIQEQALTPLHPDLASILNGFAHFYETQGDLQKATTLYQRALTIREHVYGSHHSKAIETRESLSAVLHQMSKNETEGQHNTEQLIQADMEGEGKDTADEEGESTTQPNRTI